MSGPTLRPPVLALTTLLLATAAWGGPPVAADTETPLLLAVSDLRQGLILRSQGQEQSARERLLAAVDGLDAAVAADPASGIALQLLGLTYLELGRTEEGREALERSRRAERPGPALPPELESSPESRSRAVERAAAILARAFLAFEAAPPWQARVSLGVGRDSNPNLLAEGLILPGPDGEPVAGGTADRVAALDLWLAASPLFNRRGWSLGASARAGQSVYGELGFLDLTRGEGSLGLAWGGDPRGWLAGPLGPVRVPYRRRAPVTLLLQTGASGLLLDGSSYLRQWTVAASIQLRPHQLRPQSDPGRPGRLAPATRVELAYRDRTYFTSGRGDPRRSGGELSLGLHQSLDFPRGRSFGLGLTYSSVDAGRPFAAQAWEGQAEAGFPLGWRWRLAAAASRRAERYDHPESDLLGFNPAVPGSGRRRLDETWWASLALTRRLPGDLELTLRYGYGERDSNVEDAAGVSLGYRRQVVGLDLAWRLRGGRP